MTILFKIFTYSFYLPFLQTIRSDRLKDLLLGIILLKALVDIRCALEVIIPNRTSTCKRWVKENKLAMHFYLFHLVYPHTHSITIYHPQKLYLSLGSLLSQQVFLFFIYSLYQPFVFTSKVVWIKIDLFSFTNPLRSHKINTYKYLTRLRLVLQIYVIICVNILFYKKISPYFVQKTFSFKR